MGFFASILMDFSKAYDCLKDDLFLAKFLSKRLFLSYLNNRTQRIKIGSTFGPMWLDKYCKRYSAKCYTEPFTF